MGFLARLIGAERKHDSITVPDIATMRATGGYGITYDPELVQRLKEDHQNLVSLYCAIKAAARDGHFHELPALLTKLKLDLQTHIMLENVKFYVYVQQHCAQDAETSDFIADVRNEMDSVARAVVKFAKTYAATQIARDNMAGFNIELEQIGSVLMERVALEENRLYALYQPQY